MNTFNSNNIRLIDRNDFIAFINWAWKTFLLSVIVGVLEQTPILVTAGILDVRLAFISPEIIGKMDTVPNTNLELLITATVYGTFAFSSFVLTIRKKKICVFLILFYAINYLYGVTSTSFPIISFLLYPFTWVVSGLYTIFGILPIYIIYIIQSIGISVPILWGIEAIYGMFLGTIYQAIIYKKSPWEVIWS